MKSHLRSLLMLFGVVALATIASAQYVPPPPARPFPGYVNEALRARDPYLAAWDVGLNIRLREEIKDDAGFTDAGSNWDFSKRPQDDNNNTYTLLRLLPRVSYTSRWFAATVEARSSASFGDERYSATAPGRGLAERDGPLDLHQAFVFVGNHKEFPVSLKLGRQELSYGEMRLVGHLRWSNNARTFDAAKVRWQNGLFGVDAFTGGVVYNDHHTLNRANSQDVFSGAYFNFPTLSTREVVEAYLLHRNVSRDIASDDWTGIAAPFRFPAPQDLYTAGLRIRSKPLAYDSWDYGVELMHQFGDRTAVFPAGTVAQARTAPRLNQNAYAAVIQGGYTWTENAWQPRAAIIYSFASGDKNAADGSSQTFQNLFATTHMFYGYMDLNSLQNLHDVRLTYAVKPKANVSLAAEVHVQFLHRTSDFWYNVAGVPRNVATAANPVGSGNGYRVNPSYSRQLGTELDLVAGWTVIPSTQLELGVSRYFRGDYIKESLRTVGSKDANYVYLQITANL